MLQSSLYALALPALMPVMALAEFEARAAPPDPKYLKEYIRSPNASSLVHTDGYDVSKKYPGSILSLSWDVFVNVTADVPARPGEKDSKIVVTEIGLRPREKDWYEGPKNASLDDHGNQDYTYVTDESWGMCTGVLRVPNKFDPLVDKQGRPANVSRSCAEEEFPEGCLAWIRKYMKDGRLCRMGHDDDEWLRSPCKDTENPVPLDIRSESIFGMNGSSLHKSRYIRRSSEYTGDGMAIYDTEAAQTWMVIVGWLRKDDIDHGSVPSGKDTLPNLATCIRPNQFSEGSRDFAAAAADQKTEKEDAASALLGTGQWKNVMLGLAVGAAALLL